MSLAPPKRKARLRGLFGNWRRPRDSNPRYRFKPVCFLSREVPSTTRPGLHLRKPQPKPRNGKGEIIPFCMGSGQSEPCIWYENRAILRISSPHLPSCLLFFSTTCSRSPSARPSGGFSTRLSATEIRDSTSVFAPKSLPGSTAFRVATPFSLSVSPARGQRPCAMRGRPAPCTSRRSVPRS